MLNKSISVIKYFISASVWVHRAMYWDIKKNSQVSLPDLSSLRRRCYNRSRCYGRGNHPNSEVLYCWLRPTKQDLDMVERVFYTSMYIKKIMGTLPTMCECDQPTRAHLIQLPSGRIRCLGPALALDEMKRVPLCGVFCHSEASPVSRTHSLHAMQKYPLF